VAWQEQANLLFYNISKNYSQKYRDISSTGVAAVNIGGATIHSFFQFKPDVTLEKAWSKGAKAKKPELYRSLDAIVIDEISMVRADLLDCIDAFMRRVCGSMAPFGGKRVIMFGDLYQLPPVVTREDAEIFRTRYPSAFFFSADVISRTPLTFVELDHIYRQTDDEFIKVLNSIRENVATAADLNLLNTRVYEDYAPPPEEYVIHLTGTNRDAESYNTYQLNSLDGEEHTFSATSTGAFDRRTEPAPRELVLKIGAQVMMTSNDRRRIYQWDGRSGRGYRVHGRKSICFCEIAKQKTRRCGSQFMGNVSFQLSREITTHHLRGRRHLYSVTAHSRLGYYHPQESGQDV
jgi:hypothetical protein